MTKPSSRNRDIAWTDMVRFVRQLSHDLRNHLNAVELQSAYLNELTQDAELKSEIRRLREMVAQVSRSLQHLSAALTEVNPVFIPYRAADFFSDLKEKVAESFGDRATKISWDIEVGEAELNIDPPLLLQAFLELFTNAFQHEPGNGTPAATATASTGRFVFTLREPKTRFELSTENWGREPLRTASQGHYGLGLSRVRAILEAQGGELSARYDPAASALLTTITLPLSGEHHSA
jgi:K+-sensing histidine kinase KdpD